MFHRGENVAVVDYLPHQSAQSVVVVVAFVGFYSRVERFGIVSAQIGSKESVSLLQLRTAWEESLERSLPRLVVVEAAVVPAVVAG